MTDGRAGVEIISLVLLLFTCIYKTIGFGNKIYFLNINLTFTYNELEEYLQI